MGRARASSHPAGGGSSGVDVQRVTVAVPGSVAAGAAGLAALTGAPPGLRDGDDWVQADLAGTGVRLAVSSPTGGVSVPTVLLKVASVERARTELSAAGLSVGEVQRGGHELRCSVALPGVTGIEFVLYQPVEGPP